MEFTQLISTQEVARHNNPSDCWIVIDDQVWDVTAFAPEHPGGANLLLKYAGQDATKEYAEFHAPSIVKDNLALECFKGNLDRSTIDENWKREPVAANNTQAAPESEKPELHNIINSYDFEEVAARTASKKAFAFYSTAATDCWTRDMNNSMYKRIWFRPRVMRDVAEVDTSGSMLGIPLRVPLFICPTGLAKMINPEGEKALARAAKSTGILEVISTVSSHPHADILREAPDYPFLFQLYVNKDRAKAAELIQHATALGVRAIFLTVDAAGRGKRESDERIKVDEVVINPVTGQRAANDKKGGGLTRTMGSYIDQSMSWKDIAWIRSLTDVPIVLKGITNAEDAKLAMQHKVAGILVSNHGGRNLDFSPPAILVLLELHKRCPEVFDAMEVYVDGGIRRGGDILKALCLGAKAVGVGRPFLYALNYGTEGAEHLVEILKDEMESVMKLIGIKSLDEVHPGLVNTFDVDHLVPSTPDHPYAKWRPKARI
ncbi:FMN-dependent dehydrogenase-domain-containing protein [Neohortaea acidophila]|uniref:L-lactate dehydrogenase (cytochrome) n=1 Tax=Neohortaea acidophila TaxID=245834 RepID=A0A6A6PUV2_9PEZI|nr:FMN-dependent dehydrogenase-domain-containing protein [Neohortaea acidophila]KAF2483898.1 FMN-dependent dehydrogenase-domain-containing protein [Neohortaea acidophila]